MGGLQPFRIYCRPHTALCPYTFAVDRCGRCRRIRHAQVLSLLGAVFLSLPLILITLGLFLLVLNAIFLWITDKIIDGFEIESFMYTLITSAVISVFDLVLRWILPGI